MANEPVNIEFEVSGHVAARVHITDERFTMEEVIQALNTGNAQCAVVDDGQVFMNCEGELIPVGWVQYADRYFKYSNAKQC